MNSMTMMVCVRMLETPRIIRYSTYITVPVQAALPDELHDDDGVCAYVGDAPDLDNVVVGEALHEPHLPLHVVHGALGHGVRVLDHLHRHLQYNTITVNIHGM